MLDRLKSWWIAAAAVLAALAGLVGNLDRIAAVAAQVLKPWLQVETTLEVGLDSASSRPLVIAVAERDRVLGTQRVAPGAPVSFTVPINARYTLVWQGPGYKPGTVGDILAPPQISRWRLRVTGREQDLETLSLRAVDESGDRPSAPAPAALLLASTPSRVDGAAAGAADVGMAAEVDRALAVIGLFETGTTDCARSVAITPLGILFGCIGFALPGPASALIKELDGEDPGLLDRALGDEAARVRELAARSSPLARELASLAPDARARLAERLRLLAAGPEFRLRHQQLALEWYRRALRLAAGFDLASERGVLLVLDRLVLQGPGGVQRLRSAYAARVEQEKPADEAARIAILAALMKAQPAFGAATGAAARRIETIATGRSTVRGVTYDLDAIGIRADRPIAGRLPPVASAAADVDTRLRRLVAAQFGVDVAAVTPTARFIEDLGADALDVTELILGVEQEFRVDIPDEVARRLATVAEIAAWLRAGGVR